MYSFFFSFPLSSYLHCYFVLFFFAKVAAAAGTRSASQMTHSLNMRRRWRRSARFVPMYPQVLLAAAGALAKMTTTTNTTTTRRGQPPKREDSTGFGSPSLFQRQLHDDAHLLLRCSTQRDSTPRSGAVEPVEPTEPDRALTKLSQPPRRRVVMGGGVPTTTTTTTLMTTICGQRSARSISSV